MKFIPALLVILLAIPLPAANALPIVDLTPTLKSGAVRATEDGSFRIEGAVTTAGAARVLVRVGTSTALSFERSVDVTDGRFACRYPDDFPAAPPLDPMVCYIDATDAADFSGGDPGRRQAEITVVVQREGVLLPDLPLAFTDDFIDAQGRKDQASAQWPRQRFLVNRFLRSRTARLMGIGRPDFDLAHAPDFAWFKDHVSLYDFEHRDRDWTQPLGHRVARGFWQASPNRWFNPSNSHPWDGNAANRDPGNFRPYAFANDTANLLVLHRNQLGVTPVVADHRRGLADEVQANLLALQHTGADNFALAEPDGRREHYTAGAFRYGMFETGEWLTEGTGWFANPKFRDFAGGGVFNGRAAWALAWGLDDEANPEDTRRLREALLRTLRFCLHDGLALGYTVRTASGRPVWNRTPGEHGYLLLALNRLALDDGHLPVQLDPGLPARPLHEVLAEATDALVESAAPNGTWAPYADVTAVNIAALLKSARNFGPEPEAGRWRAAARKAADHWLALPPAEDAARGPSPLFGHLIRDGRLTHVLNPGEAPHAALYSAGLWLHSLALLHDQTGEARYRDRAQAILAYLCGDNPLRARLLNEIGAVNNRITDTDRDGTFDHIGWNAYPEATAFVHLGLLELLSRPPQ